MARHRLPLAVPSEPAFSELNTTPLIDVLLVLLILCILSIPLASHKVMIDLPSGPPVGRVPPPVSRLTMDAAGRLAWNGAPITLASLPAHLTTVERDPRALLEIGASGKARYEDFDRMIVVVKRSRIERIGFTGHVAFARELDR